MTKIFAQLNAVIWGIPALVLILGVGLFLSIRMGFPQIRLLPQAIRVFLSRLIPGKQKNVSSFRSLCTALGATVGTGNLVGVAGAICIGGPGAVFWMWISGLLGMGTKYAEAMLAVRYRRKTENGYMGGPMYVIVDGLGKKYRPLAVMYCLFGLIASFGVGNGTQVNAVVTAVNRVLVSFSVGPGKAGNLAMGLSLAILTGTLLLGGAKRIGAAAEKLVPIAAGAYILLCAGVLTSRREQIPSAFSSILMGAVDPKAVTGGALGSVFQALRTGCSRGVFTNEAGMGTASIAHACADVEHPVQQGLMGIVEVFLDTIVICTLTALVILVSGVPIPYGVDMGPVLTTDAFSQIYGKAASVLIALMLCAFAVATVLGWGLYGARCAQFLFGEKSWKPFALLQTAMVLLASVADTETVWQLSETINGLMVIPNLLALAALSPELVRLTKEYRKTGVLDTGGGRYYADFHQCKPL